MPFIICKCGAEKEFDDQCRSREHEICKECGRVGNFLDIEEEGEDV